MHRETHRYFVLAFALCIVIVLVASGLTSPNDSKERANVPPHSGATTPVQPSNNARLHTPKLNVTPTEPAKDEIVSPSPIERQRRLIELASGELASEVLDSLDDKYKTKRPKKVHSSLVLVLETTHRKRIVLHSLKSKLDAQQFDRACDLLELEKSRYDELLQRRHQIMNSDDRNDIGELLEYNDIATQLLSRKLTGEIYAKVMLESRMASREHQDHN